MTESKDKQKAIESQSPEPEEQQKQRSQSVESENDVTGSDDSQSGGKSTRSESEAAEEGSKGVQGQASADGQGATHGWQAIYSPQHNAYYFYNSITQETTWVNPLQPEASGSGTTSETAGGSESGQQAGDAEGSAASSSKDAGSEQAAAGPSSSHYSALQAAAIAQGIDPALAHLDPSLLSSVPGRPVDASGIPLFTAKFNRHTGAFAKADSRDPGHFSEYERAKRMSEFYFDVNQWEKQLAEQGGSIKGDEAGKKRKRLTKADMERFKEQKKQKKLAKTAWLRT
ncbi:hypothetical protein CC2G_014636 [Coprinopsis cinerea AmutBmut pab1-1]|nr:hypothetical protein CC2G_014636 [Coprinopsis cinerea AmutBmut pab1-1]